MTARAVAQIRSFRRPPESLVRMAFKMSPSHAVAAARSASLAYPEVGVTAERELPVGYRHSRRSWVIGEGRRSFDRATTALLAWQMHRWAGLRVWASSPVAEPDVVVVLGVGVARLQMFAPCHVVYDVQEERLRGFAYGTLPGHPEAGEEAFVVERQPDDAVVFHITAFSRPGTWYTRSAGPLNRLLQDAFTGGYASALHAAAADM